MTAALKKEAFALASRWSQRMAEVLHVVEDRPPHEAHWTDAPRDEADRPVWNAAVRAEARMIVTENLRDGPPANEHGLQAWNEILYIHPDTLIRTLSSTAGQHETVPTAEEVGSPSDGPSLSPDIRDFLLDLERRAQHERSEEDPPEAPST